MLNDVLMGACKQLFCFRSPAQHDIVVPKGKDAFVVLIDDHDQGPALLDAAEEVVIRCLSSSIPEDVEVKQEPIRRQLASHEELPTVLAEVAARLSSGDWDDEVKNPDSVVFSTTTKPREPWTAPELVLPHCLALVDVREMSYMRTEALLWLLQQPNLAAVAARVSVKDVEALVGLGARPAHLSRLAWLSPPKQRVAGLLSPLRCAFAEGEVEKGKRGERT